LALPEFAYLYSIHLLLRVREKGLDLSSLLSLKELRQALQL
jgi:hypothetical protein